ncbi:MAG: hypothetical protein CMJ34_07225 [Phycisphaerae bacterium]|nr:hypothetical protein [Phycisphaerae bacterium]
MTASILWWVSIVVWFAAIATSGGAAISAFTVLPEIGATMPGIDAYFADDPEGAARFVAGYVTNPIFLVSDRICFFASVACLLSFPMSGFRPCGPGVTGRIAVTLAVIAMVAQSFYLWGVAPELSIELERWREAVLVNDREAAETAWSAFDPLHEDAATLLNVQMAMLLGAVVAGAISSARRHGVKAPNP